jgi:pimeloyl-ACP methyl ester carboxylesterase
MAETPRLLLIHGILSGGSVWRRVRRELGEAAVVMAPDLPGFGRCRWQGDAYTVEALAEWLAPLVEDEGVTRVAGHSMGGIVALALAERFPRRIERVGVIGLPLFRDRPAALQFLRPRGRVVGAFLRSDAVAHPVCVAAAAAYPAWHALAKRYYPLHPRAVMRGLFTHNRAAHGAFGSIVFAGLAEQLALRSTVPVAALHGTRDRAAPLAEVQRIALARGWDLAVADGANHQAVIERPGMVAEWIRRAVLLPEANHEPWRMHPAGEQVSWRDSA